MTPSLNNLLAVIDKLTGPEGCPWDRAQTPQTLCDYLVEEVYELIASIRAEDAAGVEEEMGDVFFLLFFISRLYWGKISLDRVWDKAAAKMVGRHPHVFAEARIKDQEELIATWERIKKNEQGKDGSSGPFDSLPADLPPLLKA
ncbi:MAG: MazG nucleotide pyrophosphohydrolase domain-containing protein [Desulfonatronovibrionaceae bacterium]